MAALYQRLLSERAREELEKDTPERAPQGLYSQLRWEAEREPPRPYGPGKQIMRTLIERGPTNAGTGMMLAYLKKRYPASYSRLKARKMGQIPLE